MNEPEDVNWKPVVPFLNQNPVYCYGVEFGMLYAQMERKRRD